MRLLDARFKYTPSTSTNIVTTWKRHGYKPTTEAERLARQRRAMGITPRSASVTSIDSAKTQTAAGAPGEQSRWRGRAVLIR